MYRKIPKVDLLLETDPVPALIVTYGHKAVMDAIRRELEKLRSQIRDNPDPRLFEMMLDALPYSIEKSVKESFSPNVKKVINATGTILHTNLGRSPIMRSQAEQLADIVSGYSNLEYNLETGTRGERYAHFEELLKKLTGAGAAMAVNNNAAAVLLVLSTLAKGGEAIVSRGELIEIGGKFRIPDVCGQSGARLVEVGTTNKTHPDDYKNAITEETKVILKVHTSNYRILGFTESVPAAEIKNLAAEFGIPVVEDLGSGVLVNLEKYGLSHEPTVQEAVEAGVDVVCFSGDKLLGGPQAGIIVGKKEYIEKMKKNPLTRAIRIDKFTVAALELVLLEYLNMENIEARVPVLRMISEPEESVRERAERLLTILQDCSQDMQVRKCLSQVGGGSLPGETIRSYAVVIRPAGMSAAALENRLRYAETPVIARVLDDAVWLDLRTVAEEEMETLSRVVAAVISGNQR